MMHHNVMWKFQDHMDEDKQREIVQEFKQRLLEVAKQVSGVNSIEIIHPVEKTSNMDLMLLSAFQTTKELENYQNHPFHQEAVRYLKPYIVQRSCIDY